MIKVHRSGERNMTIRTIKTLNQEEILTIYAACELGKLTYPHEQSNLFHVIMETLKGCDTVLSGTLDELLVADENVGSCA